MPQNSAPSAAPDLTALIKAYDVRGVVPDQFDARIARAIGAAFGDVVVLPDGTPEGADRPTVVIGNDMRPSGPELVDAFADGLAARGVDVVRIGLCSTDGLYYASGALGMPGAMFTASHNPAEYNGIKLCRPARARSARTPAWPRSATSPAPTSPTACPRSAPTRRGQVTDRDLLADYAAFLRSLVDLSGIRPLKVVVDAGNGMGGLTAPAVLGTGAGLPELPLDVVPLYFELDGTFPNHEANPLEPENLRDLQAAVVEHGADLGLAFDGDADRCFVIDENGDPVSPSAITALVGLREVERERAAGRDATVIHNLITSQVVPDLRDRRRRDRRPHPRRATPSSRRRWPSTTPSSAASTARTTTSATSSSPTPACSPRCTCSRRSAARTHPLSALAEAYQPYVGVGRDQLPRRGRRRRPAARVVEAYVTDAGRRPGHRRRARRPDASATGTPSRAGGSTCARPTPSRCCGSTSRRPTRTSWRRCATTSSRSSGRTRRRPPPPG